MKIEETHIETIKKQFSEMKTKEDLVLLLNETNQMLYGEKSKDVPLKFVSYFANPNFSKNRYKTFTIKKKLGGERIINAPSSGLKQILVTLNTIFQSIYTPHKSTFGFVQNKNIVDNAKQHTNKHYVYNIDLKNFFHSFDRNRVKMGIWYHLFNMEKDKIKLSLFIASLCTHPLELNGETKVVLPQGSPTSPTLTNIFCNTLDRRLNGLAKRFGAKYSRYADDISFSSNISIFKKEEFLNELNRIIKDQNFEINPKKTRLLKSDFRQEVTGLTVNEKVNVRKKYTRQLRMWLSYWEKYGFEKANKIFLNDYYNERGHLLKGTPNFENVLSGKLEYLKMVKGFENTTYLKLKYRLDKLVSKSVNKELNILLNVWEKAGIENAIDFFNKNGL